MHRVAAFCQDHRISKYLVGSDAAQIMHELFCYYLLIYIVRLYHRPWFLGHHIPQKRIQMPCSTFRVCVCVWVKDIYKGKNRERKKKKGKRTRLASCLCFSFRASCVGMSMLLLFRSPPLLIMNLSMDPV